MNTNGHEAAPSEHRDVNDQRRLRHARDRETGFRVGQYLQPPPMLFTRDGHNVFLGDMYRGATAFLICAGPSLKQLNLDLLDQRGLLTAAVNNAATVHRPNMWITVDDPGNFCEGLWRDPGMLKFTPLCHMEKPFQMRGEQGDLAPSQEMVGDMPGVFGYRRNEAFRADQFLYEDTFNWGNHGDRTDSLGVKGSRSVFLVALRMLFYLGIRTINLIGCDFKMRYRAANYAFEQARSRLSVNGNNATYRALNKRLEQLLPYFAKEGLRIFNCTPDSGLTAFPKRNYEEAIEAATGTIPELQTEGMYDRKANEQAESKAANTLRVVKAVNAFPEVTLVTAVDRKSASVLQWTLKTWRQFRPDLFQHPPLILHSPDVDPKQDLSFAGTDVRTFSVDVEADQNPHDSWARAWLSAPSQHVDTKWWLKLAAETVCRPSSERLNADWLGLRDDDPPAVMLAHRWGYTKPADTFAQLNAWANSHPLMQATEAVEVAGELTADRIRHETINTFFCLCQTSWTKQMAELVAEPPPRWNVDSLWWFLARRFRQPIIQTNVKAVGWDHSFAKDWNPIKESRWSLGRIKEKSRKR